MWRRSLISLNVLLASILLSNALPIFLIATSSWVSEFTAALHKRKPKVIAALSMERKYYATISSITSTKKLQEKEWEITKWILSKKDDSKPKKEKGRVNKQIESYKGQIQKERLQWIWKSEGKGMYGTSTHVSLCNGGTDPNTVIKQSDAVWNAHSGLWNFTYHKRYIWATQEPHVKWRQPDKKIDNVFNPQSRHSLRHKVYQGTS